VPYEYNNLIILSGNGDGTFSLTLNKTLPIDSGYSVQSGDINNDGYLDLLITSQVGKNGVLLYKNNYGNSFSVFASIQTPSLGSAFADFNNDDLLDFVVFPSSVDAFNVYINLGSSFSLVSTPSNEIWYFPGVADMNLDGRVDVLAGNYNSQIGLNTLPALPGKTCGGCATINYNIQAYIGSFYQTSVTISSLVPHGSVISVSNQFGTSPPTTANTAYSQFQTVFYQTPANVSISVSVTNTLYGFSCSCNIPPTTLTLISAPVHPNPNFNPTKPYYIFSSSSSGLFTINTTGSPVSVFVSYDGKPKKVCNRVGSSSQWNCPQPPYFKLDDKQSSTGFIGIVQISMFDGTNTYFFPTTYTFSS